MTETGQSRGRAGTEQAKGVGVSLDGFMEELVRTEPYTEAGNKNGQGTHACPQGRCWVPGQANPHTRCERVQFGSGDFPGLGGRKETTRLLPLVTAKGSG